jgi:hypothetical protein
VGGLDDRTLGHLSLVRDGGGGLRDGGMDCGSGLGDDVGCVVGGGACALGGGGDGLVGVSGDVDNAAGVADEGGMSVFWGYWLFGTGSERKEVGEAYT